MNSTILQVSGEDFVLGDKKIILRGMGLGTWLNLEHFMLGIPGTDSQIRQAFAEVYGRTHAADFLEDFAKCFITENDFKLFKELGINAVRIPVRYNSFESQEQPGMMREEGFVHVDRTLELCARYGIYAVIDMHTAPGGQNPDWHADNQTGISQFWEDALLRERIIKLWSAIAKRYKSNAWIAGYDIINEPALVPDAAVLNEFYDRTAETIRKEDAYHILFIEGDDWARDFSPLESMKDSQVAYEFHRYPSTLKYPESYSRKELEDVFLTMIDKIRDKFHKPLLLGETGVIFTDKRRTYNVGLMRGILDIMEENSVSWTIWTYKDAKTVGVVYPKDNTPWMQFVKVLKNSYGMNYRMDMENDLLTYEVNMADDIISCMEDRYFGHISEAVKPRVQYRLRGMLHYLYVEEQLKPRLRKIPWETMKEYPRSFLLENCQIYEEMANLIKSYTIEM